MSAVLALVRPGDEHALAHGRLDAVAAGLAALAAAIPGARVEAGQVVAVFPGADDALAAALRAVSVGGVAAAVGAGPVTLAAGSAVGLAAGRTRRLAALARVGEVLLLDPVAVAVPDGVGVFAAPAALQAAVGGPVRALRDHR